MGILGEPALEKETDAKLSLINNNKSDGLCKCFILAWPIGLIQRAVPQNRQGRNYHRGDGSP